MPLASLSMLPASTGTLWLRHLDSGAPTEALLTSATSYQAQPTTLVLGPTGSGRSVMLARLGEAAHAAGDCVVFLDFGPGTPSNQVTQRVGGRSQPVPVGFNPFYLPDYFGGGWRYLSGFDGVDELASLLNNLFSLGLVADDLPAGRLVALQHVLERYYDLQAGGLDAPTRSLLADAWQARPGNVSQQWHAGPSFNSFYEFLVYEVSNPDLASMRPALNWLIAQGHPYYAGGDLDYLLNALPDELAATFDAPGRCLNLFFEPSTPRPLLTCQCWLLLYSLDAYLVRPAVKPRRLSILANFLPEEALAGPGEDFFFHYEQTRRSRYRALTLAYQLLPAALVHRPALLATFSRRIILARSYWGASDLLALTGLDPGQQQHVQRLCPSEREVAIFEVTGCPPVVLHVYSAWLEPGELRSYQPPHRRPPGQ